MRTLASFLMTSLDGFHEGPNHELDWHNVDDEFRDFALQQLNAADTLIFGRVTYEMMAGYWTTEAAAGGDPLVAAKMNGMPKLVVSRSLASADWSSTTLISGDLEDAMAELKPRDGGQLLVLGSARLTASLAESGLLDELRVMVNPVVLGRGSPLMHSLGSRLRLELLGSRIFGSGNVLLTYRPLT
jgi:dihydrofolate reductase